VDSLSLLKEINKQGKKNNRVIDCLLQVHIAREETKFGFNKHELNEVQESPEFHELKNVKIMGLMGMASFSDDKELVRSEFAYLKQLFDSTAQISKVPIEGMQAGFTNFQLSILSMGMSGDYTIALEEGSNMVRIGSLLFGERNYTK
jgi:PLP dependent protein